MKYTVILTPDEEDGGFVAECPAIAGCISEGNTVEEALANIKEAIEGCLESLTARNEPLPHDNGVIVTMLETSIPSQVVG